MAGRGRRGAVALWVVLAAAAALLACAGGASAAGPPPPVSIVIDDGLTASDSGNALPPALVGAGESVAENDAALLRLALTLARSEGVAVADDPSFLLGILLQNESRSRAPTPSRSCSGSGSRTARRSREPMRCRCCSAFAWRTARR